MLRRLFVLMMLSVPALALADTSLQFPYEPDDLTHNEKTARDAAKVVHDDMVEKHDEFTALMTDAYMHLNWLYELIYCHEDEFAAFSACQGFAGDLGEPNQQYGIIASIGIDQATGPPGVKWLLGINDIHYGDAKVEDGGYLPGDPGAVTRYNNAKSKFWSARRTYLDLKDQVQAVIDEIDAAYEAKQAEYENEDY